MTDDHRLCNTQHRCATIIFKIETVEIFVFKILPFADLIKRFGKFQDHIAYKTFANHHISHVEQNVATFNVADKMNVLYFPLARG